MSFDFAIRARNLSKCYQIYDRPRDRLLQMLSRGRKHYYREFWALSDVSFDIKRGETVGIIGRNGSGKSTLLQLLCGTLNPTSGTVEVNGRIAALLELGAGFNPEFTGRENVYLNAAILGLTVEQIEDRLEAIEAFAEIGSFIDQPVKTYSSGMYVRLAFSVAIHTDPGILIVDEALSVGDARFQAKCLNRIKAMKDTGVSILFVSHDINAVRLLCDRAIWLDSGTIRQSGNVFPVTAEYTEFIFSESPQSSALAGTEMVPEQSQLVEAVKQKPLNHWGTHPGTILSAGIHDREGRQKSVFMDNEAMQIRVRFHLTDEIDREKIGIAFSIKDLSGTDLIVSGTWGNLTTPLPHGSEAIEVRFDLENYLNTGDYLLVVAVEDRSSATIEYYEYIEGAQFFSTAFQGNPSGRFIAPIRQSVLSIQDDLTVDQCR